MQPLNMENLMAVINFTYIFFVNSFIKYKTVPPYIKIAKILPHTNINLNFTPPTHDFMTFETSPYTFLTSNSIAALMKIY